MKYKKYIENLSSMEDDINEGMLSQLREEPPEELHGQIMKSIGREKKKSIFHNYRIYVPAVAAVFIFAIALKGINGNNDINSIIKSKMPEKYETADISGMYKNDMSKNIKGNHDLSSIETSDNTGSSTNVKNPTAADKNTSGTSKDAASKGSKSGKGSTDSKGTQTASTGKTTLDSLADRKTNNTPGGSTTNSSGGTTTGGNTSNTTPNALEQNKKVLGWMTEFNAVAAENKGTYKMSAYEFKKLQQKIESEGINDSVFTVLSTDGQYITFKLNTI